MENNLSKNIVIFGSGGFIGGYLSKHLIDSGFSVRCVDMKPLHEWEQLHVASENIVADLSLLSNCMSAVSDMDYVFQLAADMGGMGFIENNKCLCMLSVLITTYALKASLESGVKRLFYSSSACVYAADKQDKIDISPLKESDAYPAMPEDGYGWEKLFSERMCRHFTEDFRLETRVARLHNVYGPNGTWHGGREKAPAAICRKIATAKLTGEHEINIWGDGTITRSFQYIDDCIYGIDLIMNSDIREPINLGTSEQVTVNQLVDVVEEIAEIKVKRSYDLTAPQGVMGRNSDNTKILELLGWEPSITLRDGIKKTYTWIYEQVKKDLGKKTCKKR